ncbi:MAG TPA: MFS transporter [Candidatus Acidoferrales bacterium]|nr:MFS transporter [Candidatus Acidoferrales bacterium]
MRSAAMTVEANKAVAVEAGVDAASASAARKTVFGRGFWLLFWATFALNSSSNMFVLFPLYLVKLGAGAKMIGAVVGTFSLAALAARPGVGILLDRSGRQRTAMLLLALDVAVIGLYLTLGGLGLPMFAVRTIHGVVEGTARVALFAMVYEFLPVEGAGRAMSIFSLCGMGSAGVGPVLGEWVIGRWGFAGFFGVAMTLIAIAASATALIHDDRRAVHAGGTAQTPQGPGYATLLGDRALMPLWIATVLFSLSISPRLSFVAPFAQQKGITDVAWYFVLYSVPAVLVRMFGARLMDDVGLERMVAPSLAVLGIGMALIAGAGKFQMLYVAALVGGLGHGYVYPALSALVIRRTHANSSGRSSSIYSSLYDIGMMAGPYGLGVVASLSGYGPMFIFSGVIALGGAAFFIVAEPDARPRRMA